MSYIVLGERALLLSLLDKMICLGIDDTLGYSPLGKFSKTQEEDTRRDDWVLPQGKESILFACQGNKGLAFLAPFVLGLIHLW